MTAQRAAAPATLSESLGPVSTSERVETIDILRGLALLGILAANMRGFSGPPSTYFLPHLFWTAPHDRIAQALIDTFVQGKFIAIFAFLFGVGFAVQFDRARARGAGFGLTYTRRLLVLLLLGLVHGLLIWFGDILLVYALAGFLLLLFRERRDKTLLVWAVILLSLMPLAITGAFVAARFGAKLPDLAPSATEIATAAATYANGTWLEIQRHRATDAVKHNWSFLPMILWQALGYFLLGALAWRRRFFQPGAESLPRYRAAMRWGLAVGVAGNLAVTVVRWIGDPSPMPKTWLAYSMVPVQAVSVPALSLGYVCFVILVCQDARARARLHSFAAVGRTALTNYLLQSVIGTLVFYSYGLGLFGAGPAVLLPLTLVIFAVELVASSWWLSRYRFGPAEWLWRRLTYRGHLPIREEPRVAAGPIPM